MSPVVADIFRQGAERNLSDARRHGNLLNLGPNARMLVTGDLHGHRANLDRILRFAAPDRHKNVCLILQEVIHGQDDPRTGGDRSVEQLLRAVRLQCRFPDRVIFLMGNHDLAQITGTEIIKNGRGACKAFREGTLAAFGEDGHEVLDAVEQFLRSVPLAARTPGGTLISHSLPEPPGVQSALDVLARSSDPADLQRGAGVYQWVWGRRADPETLDTLAEALDVNFFVTGHRKIDGAWELFDDRAIALASDEPRGCVLEFSAEDTLTAETAGACVRLIPALLPA